MKKTGKPLSGNGKPRWPANTSSTTSSTTSSPITKPGTNSNPHARLTNNFLCTPIREVWSAAADGEPFEEVLGHLNRQAGPFTIGDVDAHMSQCPACVAVSESTARFRRLRLRPATSFDVDLRPAIRIAIDRDSTGPARAPRAMQSRRFAMAPSVLMALMVTGAAQALGALPDLLGSTGGGAFAMNSGAEHLTREAAASEIALAAGFIYVALKPFSAAAVRVIASVLTALVIIGTFTRTGALATDVFTNIRDSANSGLSLETHHIIALFGTALLWLLPSSSASLRSPFLNATLASRFSAPFSR